MEFFVDDSKVQQGLANISRTMRDWGSTVARHGALITAAGAGILAPLAFFTKEAGQAEIMMTVFRTRFKELTDQALTFADALAKSTRSSVYSVREALSTFHAFFLSMDFAEDSAFLLSKALTSMALDLSATYGLTLDDSIRRFVSAISGSPEVLDRFGANLKAPAIDMELLRLGFSGTSATAHEWQKNIARATLMVKALAAQDALGNAVTLSDKFGVLLGTSIPGKLKDFRIAVGTHFLVPATKMALKLVDFIGGVTEWVQANRGFIQGIGMVGVALVSLGLALTAIGLVIKSIGIFIGTSSYAILKFGRAIAKLLVWGKALAFFFFSFPGVIVTAIGALLAAWMAMSKRGQEAFQSWKRVFTAIGEGVATMGKFLMRGEFEAAGQVAAATWTLVWKQAWLALKQTVFGIWNDILDKISDVVAGITKVVAFGIAQIKILWNSWATYAANKGDEIYVRFSEAVTKTNLEIGRATGLITEQQYQRTMEAMEDVWKANRDASKAASRARVEEDMKYEMKSLGKMMAAIRLAQKESEAWKKARREAMEAGLQDDIDDLEELQAVLELYRKAAEMEAGKGEGPQWVQDFMNATQGFGGMVDDMKSAFAGATGGTFIAAHAARMLATDSYQKRTANATEKIQLGVGDLNKGIEGVRDDIQAVGVFS